MTFPEKQRDRGGTGLNRGQDVETACLLQHLLLGSTAGGEEGKAAERKWVGFVNALHMWLSHVE